MHWSDQKSAKKQFQVNDRPSAVTRT